MEGVCSQFGRLFSRSFGALKPPVGGILHVRLEVVAPREVSSFPFKVAEVTRVMTVRVSFVFLASPFFDILVLELD